jgi:hypothetical protein
LKNRTQNQISRSTYVWNWNHSNILEPEPDVLHKVKNCQTRVLIYPDKPTTIGLICSTQSWLDIHG